MHWTHNKKKKWPANDANGNYASSFGYNEHHVMNVLSIRETSNSSVGAHLHFWSEVLPSSSFFGLNQWQSFNLLNLPTSPGWIQQRQNNSFLSSINDCNPSVRHHSQWDIKTKRQHSFALSLCGKNSEFMSYQKLTCTEFRKKNHLVRFIPGEI